MAKPINLLRNAYDAVEIAQYVARSESLTPSLVPSQRLGTLPEALPSHHHGSLPLSSNGFPFRYEEGFILA